MIIRASFWRTVALAALCAQGSSAFAQVGGSNGPITGIPSGLGANGSMTFTPGPANQVGEPGSIGNLPPVSLPGTLGRPTRTPHGSRALRSPRP